MRARTILWTAVFFLVVAGGLAGFAVHRAVGTYPIDVPETLRGEEPGSLVTADRIGKYPGLAFQYFLNHANLSDPIDVQSGATLYRVQYRTTNYDGAITTASGLLAIPDSKPADCIVGYFHGTNAQRTTAPSSGGVGEGLLVAAAVSGTGHILVAPDYIGLGTSRGLHPYMHAETEASTSIDFFSAARDLLGVLNVPWPDAMYLLGFSQGGHATFAVQRELEKGHNPTFKVKASAPIAGPFHLHDISFPQALTGQTDSHVFYLAYMANAYATIYRHPLDSVLAKPYAERLPTLFDGDHESDAISAALPKNPKDLFTPEFLAIYENDGQHWFLDALRENDVCDWTPDAPVRIYYGDHDVDVLPEEARRAEEEMKSRGADVTAVSVGPWNHNASVLHAVPIALQWFSEMELQ